MSKPTKEEYDKAVQDVSNLASWIHMERDRQNKLLDEALDCRKNIKLYEEAYVNANNVIIKWNMYEQIKKEMES